MFPGTEEWCKVKRKTDFGSKNDMRNLVNFHPTTQKSNNFTSMSYFCPNYMRFELKKIQRSYLLWHWSDAKWHNELGELSLEHPKSEKLYFDGSFLSKAFNVSARKFQRNYVSWQWRVMQNLKLTCGLKNNLRNLLNFHVSSWKSKNLHFDGLLLSKAYKDLDEKVQKSYVS